MSVLDRPSAKWVSRATIPTVFGISAKEVERAFDDGAPIRRRYWKSKPLFSADDIDKYIDQLEEDRNFS